MQIPKGAKILLPNHEMLTLDNCELSLRYCQLCDLYYVPRRKNQRYHNEACKQKAYRLRKLETLEGD
jgi:hypothetical protein